MSTIKTTSAIAPRMTTSDNVARQRQGGFTRKGKTTFQAIVSWLPKTKKAVVLQICKTTALGDDLPASSLELLQESIANKVAGAELFSNRSRDLGCFAKFFVSCYPAACYGEVS
jgi:hypothetical protein